MKQLPSKMPALCIKERARLNCPKMKQCGLLQDFWCDQWLQRRLILFKLSSSLAEIVYWDSRGTALLESTWSWQLGPCIHFNWNYVTELPNSSSAELQMKRAEALAGEYFADFVQEGNDFSSCRGIATSDDIVNSSYWSSAKEFKRPRNATFWVQQLTLGLEALCISQAIVGLLFSWDLNGVWFA